MPNSIKKNVEIVMFNNPWKRKDEGSNSGINEVTKMLDQVTVFHH